MPGEDVGPFRPVAVQPTPVSITPDVAGTGALVGDVTRDVNGGGDVAGGLEVADAVDFGASAVRAFDSQPTNSGRHSPRIVTVVIFILPRLGLGIAGTLDWLAPERVRWCPRWCPMREVVWRVEGRRGSESCQPGAHIGRQLNGAGRRVGSDLGWHR